MRAAPIMYVYGTYDVEVEVEVWRLLYQAADREHFAFEHEIANKQGGP